MITIKFFPNLLSSEGHQKREIDFVPGCSINDYIGITGFENTGKVIIAGRVVRDLSEQVRDGDEIIIVPDVAFDPVSGAFTWAAFWNFIATTVATMVISFAVSYGLNLLFARKPNRNTSGSGIDEGSLIYGWDGIKTTQEIGTPLAVVYGEHMVGGNIINQYLAADGDKHYLNTLLALSEGEIDSITSVRINDNPKENYDGITYAERLGTNAQSVIPNFEDLHDINTVAVNLTKNNAHTYTTNGLGVQGFDVNFTFPQGVYEATNQGNINPWSITFKIEWRVHGTTSWLNEFDVTYTIKARTSAYRIYSVRGISPAQYDIRITRTSDDSSLDPVLVGDSTWASLDEIVTEDLSYPNTALIGIQALATDQLNGQSPNFQVEIRGRKISVPAVMNGASAVDWEDYYYDSVAQHYKLLSDDTTLSWDGTTYRTEWCANPVWCLKDLLTNTRYGLGEFIDSTMIDDSSFIAMSQYCENKVSDGNSGWEKRFTLNIVLDSATRALDAVVQIAQVFRGLVFYSSGTIKVKIDKPDVPCQLFGMGNIVSGSFNQNWVSIKDRFNVVEVQYLDKTKLYVQEKVAVIDDAAISAGTSLRKQQLRVFSTSARQAYREARYLMYRNKYVTRSVSFKAGIDAIVCEAGDLINVSHDVPQWGFSGNIAQGISTTSVKLNQNVTITGGKSYKLMIRSSSDVVEERTVTNSAGTTDTITVSANFSFTPAVGDVYAFGESTVETKPFRIQQISVGNDHTAEITAVEYNESIYDDTAPPNPTDNYSALSFEIPPVSNVALSEAIIVANDGTIQSGIDVWFQRPDSSSYAVMYAKARVYISNNAGLSWEFVGETYGSNFQIRTPLEIGVLYRVAVVSVSAANVALSISGSPYSTITLTGLPPNPGNVSGLTYSWANVLTLAWNPNTDADLAGYEIRDENANWGSDGAHLIYRGLATTKVLYPVARTVGTYYIKAFNTSGGYSATAASIAPALTAPSAPSSLTADVLFNLAKVYWTDTGGANNLFYEVYKSYTNAWGGEESLVARVSGKSCDIISRAPRSGIAASGSTTALVDPNLTGFGDGYFIGCTVEITKGTGVGQTATVTGFTDATGTIQFSALATALDSTSQYIILDNVYIKVRAVDQYGVGAFSSALYVNFQNLDENAFGDNVITARKIYVACLSALSANVGCLTSGVIQGVIIQTASGGARTIVDQYGIHSYDASCCKLFDVTDGVFCLATALSGARTVFEAGGIYGYGSDGCQNLRIYDGCICALNARFQDPACCCNYSFLDAGRLKFHDILGDVPYLTRICSGVAITGGVVCLPGWKQSPNVIVGIRNLQSFNASAPSSCQTWNVYSDTPVCWCNSATDYGYCFIVHACLNTSSSQGATCARDIAFGACYLTGTCVCSVYIRHRLQIWCNAACANYFAGCLCFDVCYRVNGSGTWCACSFNYLQPHASTGEIMSNQDVYVTVNLPCGACWQFMTCQTGLSWHDAGISSAGVSCAVCCRPITGASLCACLCKSGSTTGGACCCCGCVVSTGLAVAGSVPTNMFCSYICHCMCTTTYCGNNGLYAVACATYGGTCSARARGLICGCVYSHSDQALADSWLTNPGTCCCVSCNVLNGTPMCHNYTGNCSCVCMSMCACGFYCGYTGCYCVSANLCFLGGALYHCYCYLTGTAACCNYQNLYTTQDTFASQCVLDPSGCLNWLAIAY